MKLLNIKYFLLIAFVVCASGCSTEKIFVDTTAHQKLYYPGNLNGESPDTCQPLDGDYNYIGELYERNEEAAFVERPLLPTIIFSRPSSGIIDAVRIIHDRERRILHVQVLGKNIMPGHAVRFSQKYDACIDGKVVFTEHYDAYGDGVDMKYNVTTALWLDSDKALMARGITDGEFTSFFIFKTKRHIEGTFRFQMKE